MTADTRSSTRAARPEIVASVRFGEGSQALVRIRRGDREIRHRLGRVLAHCACASDATIGGRGLACFHRGACQASTNSIALANRSSGLTAVAFCNTASIVGARSGRSRASDGTGRSNFTRAIVDADSPSNGGTPASSSQTIAPKLYRSDRAETPMCWYCSGLAYSGDPAEYSPPPSSASSAAAMPKSARWAFPETSYNTFAGFTSRWTTPAACAADSAPPICSTSDDSGRAPMRHRLPTTARRCRRG